MLEKEEKPLWEQWFILPAFHNKAVKCFFSLNTNINRRPEENREPDQNVSKRENTGLESCVETKL